MWTRRKMKPSAPLTSRPRSIVSRLIRRARRTSSSVSTKIFMLHSWRTSSIASVWGCPAGGGSAVRRAAQLWCRAGVHEAAADDKGSCTWMPGTGRGRPFSATAGVGEKRGRGARQDPLEDDHIPRLHGGGGGGARVRLEVVDGHLDRLAGLEVHQALAVGRWEGGRAGEGAAVGEVRGRRWASRLVS